MIISHAVAADSVVNTGSSGGGNAVLVILGVAILFALFHQGRKRLRKRAENRVDRDES
jgi:hypothetical protein